MRFVVDWVRVTSLEEPKNCWIAFSQDEFTIWRYETLPMFIYTNPEAQDRTVCWEVENDWVLRTLEPNHVKGNFYGDNGGTTRIIITTPAGGWTTCNVTVLDDSKE